jgi:hypothetical protein
VLAFGLVRNILMGWLRGQSHEQHRISAASLANAEKTVLAVGLTKTVEASHAEPSPNELDGRRQICANG